MTGARVLALCAIAAAFAVPIAAHEEPIALLVGLSPLIWVALEGVYRLIGNQPPADAAPGESRTGMRREPKGLPNFW